MTYQSNQRRFGRAFDDVFSLLGARLRMIYKRIARRRPEGLTGGDPYAYVMAPKRPLIPGRSAAAVAELAND